MTGETESGGRVSKFVRRLFRRNTKSVGDELEFRVLRLYKKLGKNNVQRNISLKDSHGNLSQIDVTYGFIFKTYIECKNYAPDHLVPLSDVAKFKEVLRQNNISSGRGIFITTSTYVPRAEHVGIKLLDGKQLRSLERWATTRLFFKRSIIAASLGGVGFLWYRGDINQKKLQEAYDTVYPQVYPHARLFIQSAEKLWKDIKRKVNEIVK